MEYLSHPPTEHYRENRALKFEEDFSMNIFAAFNYTIILHVDHLAIS